MRLIGLLVLTGALASFALPAAVSAADLGPGVWEHQAIERPAAAKAPRRARSGSSRTHASRYHRVAYSDCRTGWWQCRCDGPDRRPVWSTRCR